CGPGNPSFGKPKGQAFLYKVYSCSIPNHGSMSLYFSDKVRSLARVLLSWAIPFAWKTSHKTKICGLPRIGSGTKNTGFKAQSLKLPSACIVEDPSKPQSGISRSDVTSCSKIFVFERK